MGSPLEGGDGGGSCVGRVFSAMHGGIVCAVVFPHDMVAQVVMLRSD